jgi:hypothetical protein
MPSLILRVLQFGIAGVCACMHTHTQLYSDSMAFYNRTVEFSFQLRSKSKSSLASAHREMPATDTLNSVCATPWL